MSWTFSKLIKCLHISTQGDKKDGENSRPPGGLDPWLMIKVHHLHRRFSLWRYRAPLFKSFSTMWIYMEKQGNLYMSHVYVHNKSTTGSWMFRTELWEATGRPNTGMLPTTNNGCVNRLLRNIWSTVQSGAMSSVNRKWLWHYKPWHNFQNYSFRRPNTVLNLKVNYSKCRYDFALFSICAYME